MSLNFSSFIAITVIALLVEAITENISWLVDGGWIKERIIAFVGAILVAVLAGVDVFPAIGVPLMIPYAGSVLTGVLLARGGNALHDLIVRIQTVESTQPQTIVISPSLSDSPALKPPSE